MFSDIFHQTRCEISAGKNRGFPRREVFQDLVVRSEMRERSRREVRTGNAREHLGVFNA